MSTATLERVTARYTGKFADVVDTFMERHADHLENATNRAIQNGLQSDQSKMHGDDIVTDKLDLSYGIVDTSLSEEFLDDIEAMIELTDRVATFVDKVAGARAYVREMTPMTWPGDTSLHLIILLDHA